MARLVRYVSLISLFVLIFTIPVYAQKKLTASEAKEHFEETATVCGEVVSHAVCHFNKGTTDISESRQTVSKSDFYNRDLGKQSEQVWKARRRIQR